jgi:hypothetical protein
MDAQPGAHRQCPPLIFSEVMFAVAIVELATPPEEEAQALATDLRVTAFEMRVILAGGPPALLRVTADKDQALDLLARVRLRGHGAIACDMSAVASSSDMVSMRRFRLAASGIEAEGALLPFDDVLALIPAYHRGTTETQTETRERKFRPMAAFVSGGIVMTKVETKVTTSRQDTRDHVLYVYRRSGQRPFFLRAEDTHFDGLNEPLAPSQLENFHKTVRALRERSPQATYDDRLLSIRRTPETAQVAGGLRSRTATTSSAAGTDLLAHLLALWASRQEKSPYR